MHHGHTGWRRHPRLAFAIAPPSPGVPDSSAGYVAFSVPFEPPVRFHYYCYDPPGYFPNVAACAGPWLETGDQPSPQE